MLNLRPVHPENQQHKFPDGAGLKKTLLKPAMFLSSGV
jgi:hypothetical protein